MNTYTEAFNRELENLAEDSQALLAATANVSEHKVVEARKRLTAALDKSNASIPNNFITRTGKITWSEE